LVSGFSRASQSWKPKRHFCGLSTRKIVLPAQWIRELSLVRARARARRMRIRVSE
jgi:hypothetical protein